MKKGQEEIFDLLHEAGFSEDLAGDIAYTEPERYEFYIDVMENLINDIVDRDLEKNPDRDKDKVREYIIEWFQENVLDWEHIESIIEGYEEEI